MSPPESPTTYEVLGQSKEERKDHTSASEQHVVSTEPGMPPAGLDETAGDGRQPLSATSIDKGLATGDNSETLQPGSKQEAPVVSDPATWQGSTFPNNNNNNNNNNSTPKPSISTGLDTTQSSKHSLDLAKPSKRESKKDHPSRHLTAEQPLYVDPTPATPTTSQPPSRTPSLNAGPHGPGGISIPISDRDEDESKRAGEDEPDSGSNSEIQSILEQFSEQGGGPDAEEVMSPRLEITNPMFSGPVQHPPRKSSLEPLTQSLSSQFQEFNSLRVSSSSPISQRSKDRAIEDLGPPVPPKDGTHGQGPSSTKQSRRSSSIVSPTSPQLSMHRPPPPDPEPEPSLPFDFHRFLEQLRNKKADPVARYLKSFLSEFGKKQWMVHEQVKIISDFLAFIANKMVICDVWKDVSDAEFDNAREGMEKLVMNRLYTQTFSPAILPPKPIPGAKSRRRTGGDVSLGPGRRGQHQEDVERDEVLTQKINIYAWVKLEHLDIEPMGDSGRRFLKLAQQELLKIKSYRAPRDKIICVLNCSKVIFGLLKHNKSDSSADSFMPLLIFVVLQSNPEHLVSNVQYILRFRNQEKLGGEAGYYLSSLMGAIQFVENMDRSSLTISDDDFEKNVEAAVSAIAEKHQALSPVLRQTPWNEKADYHHPESSSGRPSTEAGEGSAPRRSTSSYEGESPDGAAMSGLLRTIQKPLSTIGRIFSDEPGPLSPGYPGHPDRQSSRVPYRDGPPPHTSDEQFHHQGEILARRTLPAEEAAARQASAEAAEAQRLHHAEHANIVETLAGMFPDLDKDIISDVVYQKQGRVGLAVDACLALSS